LVLTGVPSLKTAYRRAWTFCLIARILDLEHPARNDQAAVPLNFTVPGNVRHSAARPLDADWYGHIVLKPTFRR
jgi:hypothetical protein